MAVKRHDCNLCDYYSTSKGELNEHRVNIHFPGDKICPFCDKPFETGFYRDCHIRRVHEVSPPRSLAFPSEYFECDQCSYKSKKKTVSYKSRASKTRFQGGERGFGGKY